MKHKLISKLPDVGTSIFSVMSQLANQYKAINLAQGFPNFTVDARLTDILKVQADQNIHQYTPMAGLPSLLDEIARQIENNYNRKIDAVNELLVTAGATQGIFTVFQALLHFGDEVVLLDPSYDCYAPAIALANGVAKHVELNIDFSPNWSVIEDSISSKTKMLMFNNPHNPSGTIWKEADFIALETILEKNPQLLIFSDEVYEFITFEERHISANTRKNLINRTIICSSFGKTFHITGWKSGYLVAPKYLMDEIKKVHQFLVFSVNSVAQNILAEYIPIVKPQELSSFYQSKRDLFQQLLANSRFELLPSEGSYFQVARYSEISNLGDFDFCSWLTKEIGVAAIPVSAFYKSGKDDKLIRFCYAKTDETLLEAAEKMCHL